MLRNRLRTASSMLALAAALTFADMSMSPRAHAAGGTVVGSEMSGFGRIVFKFDKPVKAQVRGTSGVVVLSFEEPLSIDINKLAAQVPSYMSVVRLDPDGKTVRFATTRQFKTNMMEAGERVFLDFLPENWQGMPPTLPQDVVEELARRARTAEDELRKTQREREKREVRDITARIGNGPTFSRLIFDVGQTVPVDIVRDGDQLSITFDAALRFDPKTVRPKLPDSIQVFESETKSGMLKVTIGVASKTDMRAFREDDTVVVDFPKPKAAGQAEAEIVLPSMPANQTAIPPPEAPKTAQQVEKAQAAPVAVRAVSDGGATLRPNIVRDGEGLSVTVPFARNTPAAAFVRQDVIWMIFDTRDTVEAIAVPADLRNDVARIDVDRAAGAAILRVTLHQPKPVTFGYSDALKGWSAAVGKAASLPTEPLLLRRAVDDTGRTILKARMPALGQVFWIDDPDTGDRMGIVTSQGPAHGMSKGQSFVEVVAQPTLHGLLIQPRSDDLQVNVGLDDVTIRRDAGLTLSLGVGEGSGSSGEASKDLLLDVENWRQALKGHPRERSNDLLRAAADAPKKDKTEARYQLAKFRLANGDANEAAGILRVIEQDDPTAVANKPVLLLRAVAAVMLNDGKEAMRFLSDPAIQLEGEAALWKAVLDANNGRWTPALVGFRQATEELGRYPDDIQLKIRPLAVMAGIESKDPAYASQQLDVVERLRGPRGDRGEIEMLRGRIADLQHRKADALVAFEAAAKSPDRMVEAQARLEHVLLALSEKKVDRAAAMAELETISVIWRRGETEVRAMAQLGEMYAEDGKWRQAFNAARRTTEIMPDHPLSRALHDNMAKAFEALFLDGRADELPKVEAVGLFYDFRSLMPVSRRGDEIVRRLADRLVELDLLDQASELLNHQVMNRLGGLQRARVAARLAVVHLMNRKPAEAVQVLKATRMNELPDDVRRGRLLLEARGLSELSRTDLALEILATQQGADIERLRADVLWRGKRWRESGEAIERVLGDKWQGVDALTDAERIDVMRAGVSYVLADDRLALDRLRQKFMQKMADSVDAKAFALVSSDSRTKAKEFRDIARTVVAEDTLSEFLNVYRQRYPDTAGAPRNPKAAEDAVNDLQRRQQQGQAAPGTPGPNG